MNIANLNRVGSVSKIKNPSILEALIIFVFPAIQKNMMSTRHSLSVDDKDVCAFAFETWKNVRFTFISFYHLSILSPLMTRQKKNRDDISK